MKITGAIFDMDGTLIDSMMFWDIFWQRLGVHYRNDPAFRPDGKTEKAIRTLPLKEAMYLLHEACGIGENGEALLKTANEMCAAFYANDVQMKPGALEFLAHCKKQGIKMCVASATARPLQEIVMNKFGLDVYFPRIFSCSEIGRGKEFPDVFIAAHEYLGTPKESTWIFEDSITALETARKAGYQTVGIYDPHNFNLDRMPDFSTAYIAEGESLARLISEI